MYHRSYEQREPIEVRVNPDQIEIVSYPGPEPSIKLSALNSQRIVARRYRNRRIGEFLKELKLTEGRCTGIPTIRQAMKENGSPPPRFKTDKGRTYFLVELPVQPAAREQAHDEAHDEAHDGAHDGGRVKLNATERQIVRVLRLGPKSVAEIVKGLRSKSLSGAIKKAMRRLDSLHLIALTIPEKPRSKRQRRQLTSLGVRMASTLVKKG